MSFILKIIIEETRILTLRPHAHAETLFQSTLLTLPPHVHVNFTAIAIFTLVDGVLRYTPPEEAFAALTRERVIMVTCEVREETLLILPGQF